MISPAAPTAREHMLVNDAFAGEMALESLRDSQVHRLASISRCGRALAG
jgi:hypothetical protein